MSSKRKDDAYVTLTCDSRDLATILAFFNANGYTPRTKSEFVRKIVEEYARNLVTSGCIGGVKTATEASEILDAVFRDGAFNPSGRLGTTKLINKQLDSGVDINLVRKSARMRGIDIPTDKIDTDKELLIEALDHMVKGTLGSVQPLQERRRYIKILVDKGHLNTTALTAIDEIVRQSRPKPTAEECVSDQPISRNNPTPEQLTETEQYRAREDKKQQEDMKHAFSTPPRPKNS